ncbi:MAG: 1-acyl-sn-glycerol-3-phosphate acyltransferase [Chitinophagales bacterium]|nr:1-acyl-sn-glycerol-3-phosphate acyltransferase [Chitinophagales bacterium]MDW8419495.1 1-acyl-sn-glycerol-3-phosphate acyltransferase [Chitinophagales bacterium]
MSGRQYNPTDYPLPYVIENIREWPIYRLTEHKEDFLREVKERAKARLLVKFPGESALRDELARVLYQERIRLTEKPWKADPKDERQFWNGIKSKYLKMGESSGITAQKLLDEIIDRYANEIVGSFDVNAFNFAKAILPQFFGRVLAAAPGEWFKTFARNVRTLHEKIPITGDVEKIRRLATRGTLVVVPTHFSNMDSIMVGWLLNELGLPAFTYGAGLNLFSIGLLSYFMNRLGAYKVDRRKKNSVYLETLKMYSTVALQRGAHSIFFPGGTRSRSGALEKKLKLGLLGTAVEAQKLHFKNYPAETAPRIYIVPCIINYHFVLEAPGLINDYLKETGKEKFLRENDEYSTSFKLLRFMVKFISASSSLSVSFGEVMDVLGNRVDDDGNSFNHLGQHIQVKNYFMTKGELRDDEQRDAEYTRILGERIVENYHRYNVVLTSHLVCFTLFELLKKKYPGVDLFTLLRTPVEDIALPYHEVADAISRLKERLKQMYDAGEVLISPELRWNVDKIIEHGMRNINLYHTASPIVRKDEHFSSEDLRLLYYYHNRLDGYGLDKWV